MGENRRAGWSREAQRRNEIKNQRYSLRLHTFAKENYSKTAIDPYAFANQNPGEVNDPPSVLIGIFYCRKGITNLSRCP